MATTLEGFDHLVGDEFPLFDFDKDQASVDNNYRSKTHEKAFKGFSPDADFDDIIRENARVAEKIIAYETGRVDMDVDDYQMLRLNSQVMVGHNYSWANAASFEELECIDPQANLIIIGGQVLKLAKVTTP